MDLKENLATNLRRMRNDAGQTQEELADRAGISFRYLGAIERSQVSASVTLLGKIASALNVDPCQLIKDPKQS